MPHTQYYKQKNTLRVRPTAQPTGMLGDVLSDKRFLLIEAAGPEETPEKKVLIFADPMIHKRSAENQKSLFNELQSLKQDGFTIYVLNTDHFEEWNKDFYPPHDLKAYLPEKLNHLLYEQKGIRANDTFIIDYYEANNIVYSEESNILEMNLLLPELSEFLALYPRNQYALLFDDTNQTQFEAFIAEHLDPKQPQKNIIPSEAIRELFLTDCELPIETICMLLNACPHLEKLILGSVEYTKNASENHPSMTLNESAFRLVKNLHLVRTDDQITEFFVSLLNRSKTLESLTFSDIDIPQLNTYFTRLDPQSDILHSLKRVSLDGRILNAEGLYALLQLTPDIQEITLPFGNIAGGFARLKPNSLPHLRRVSMRFTKFNRQDIPSLLQAAPNLQSLDLAECSNVIISAQVKPNSLPRLTEISVSSTDISMNDLYHLAYATPQLETLNISSCNHLNQHEPPAQHNATKAPHIWQKLKEVIAARIDASKCDETEEYLHYLFAASQQLNSIDLSRTVNLTLYPGEWTSLPFVRKIDFSYSTVSFHKLKPFLLGLKSLQEIDFRKCKLSDNFRGAWVLILNALPSSIKTVHVDGDKFTRDTLQKSRRNINFSLCNSDGATANAPARQSDARSHRDDKNSQPTTSPNNRFIEFATHVHDKFFNATQPSTFTFKRYFQYVDPDDYRLYPWRPQINSLKEINLLREGVFQRINIDSKRPLGKSHHGIRPATSKEGNKIILPSLNAEETLYQLNIVTPDGKILPPDQYHLEYNAVVGFYQVVLKQAGDYTIHFDITVPNALTLPPKLQLIKDRYEAFEEYATKPPAKRFESWHEFAEHLRKIKAGRCDHRTIAAYDDLITLGYAENDIRIMDNDLHAYLEVYTDHHWRRLDLGGSRSILKEEKLNITSLPETTPPLTPSVATPNAEMKQETPKPQYEFALISPLAIQKTTGKTLIITTSDDDLQSLYAEHKNSDSVFIAQRPEELSITGHHINESGKMISGTSFTHWLNEANANKTLYIDIRGWDVRQVAQLNDLLDGQMDCFVAENAPRNDARRNIKIVLIDDPKRSYYGIDFRRRVRTKSTLPPANTLLPQSPTTLEEKGTLEIDLFNSPFWQRYLAGTHKLIAQPNSDKLTLPWEAGRLLNELQADTQHHIKNIVFKNPPLWDSRFTHFMAELQGLKRFVWANHTYSIPDDLRFYQQQGYDWHTLAKNASLHSLTAADRTKVHVLSNANILRFIQETTYGYDNNDKLIIQPSLFLTHQNQIIDIMLSPDVTEGTLAELLTVAKQKNIQVRFFAPDPAHLPTHSPLHHLNLSPSYTNTADDEKKEIPDEQVSWQLYQDSYAAARLLMLKHPQAIYVDTSSLEPGELDRYATFSDVEREALLKTGEITFTAPFSAIINQLKRPGGMVILQGEIPPSLYEAFTKLSLGQVEGKSFAGKLIILPPKHQQRLVEEWFVGHVCPTYAIDDIQSRFSYIDTKRSDSFAVQERQHFQHLFDQAQYPLTQADYQMLDDKKRSQKIDEQRLHDVLTALKLRPWAMIEGPTGIGKSHFLESILPTKCKTTHHIDEWLKSAQPSTLIIDEASFMSELSGQGEHFLERFKGLLNNPPSFFWKGQYHTLTPEHKVVFAFNPASYGAGRDTSGFLTDHKLAVKFKPLPYFYVREHLIHPLLKEYGLPCDPKLSGPLVEMYQWFVRHHPNDMLMTPREIKLMVHLIAHYAKQYDPEKLDFTLLANEVTRLIGRQTVIDHPTLLSSFDKHFTLTRRFMTQKIIPTNYPPCQREAYTHTMNMLEMMHSLANAKRQKQLPPEAVIDLGLGGIILEGESNVGKTVFLNKIAAEWQKTHHQAVYEISATTLDKEAVLRQAFAEGALLIVNEINTMSLPNKLLNNYLMGKDEHGNPAKNPGFFLLASQNPASYQGRIEEDPALRRRLFKIQADWTPEQLLVSKQNDARILSTGPHFFAQNNNNDLLRMPSSPGGRCPTGRMEGLK